MNEKEARKQIELGPGMSFEQGINFSNARHYLEAIEKAKGLEEAIEYVFSFGLDRQIHARYCPSMQKLREALAKWKKDK